VKLHIPIRIHTEAIALCCGARCNPHRDVSAIVKCWSLKMCRGEVSSATNSQCGKAWSAGTFQRSDLFGIFPVGRPGRAVSSVERRLCFRPAQPSPETELLVRKEYLIPYRQHEHAILCLAYGRFTGLIVPPTLRVAPQPRGRHDSRVNRKLLRQTHQSVCRCQAPSVPLFHTSRRCALHSPAAARTWNPFRCHDYLLSSASSDGRRHCRMSAGSRNLSWGVQSPVRDCDDYC